MARGKEILDELLREYKGPEDLLRPGSGVPSCLARRQHLTCTPIRR